MAGDDGVFFIYDTELVENYIRDHSYLPVDNLKVGDAVVIVNYNGWNNITGKIENIRNQLADVRTGSVLSKTVPLRNLRLIEGGENNEGGK